jgi:flagellar basal body-associated protein FliL
MSTQTTSPKRDDDEPPAPSLLGNVQLNDPQVRALRIAVIVMAVLIVMGLVALIGRIIYLFARPAAVIPGSAAAIAPRIQTALPAGAVIKSVAVSGDRLAVHYETAAGSGVVIVDIASGRSLSRIDFVPEAPAR